MNVRHDTRKVWILGGIGALALTVLPLSGAELQHASLAPNSRLSQADIDRHVDRGAIRDLATTGLLDYWVRHSVEPNGFIQEDLDREWKPWGTQREASINGQGRQIFAMTVGYEMNRSPEYRDAIDRSLDFMMKMRDPAYGGYYDRVAPDLRVINDTKTGFSSFALDALAHAGRVTGDKRYLDAALTFFREVRDKMRDGPFIGANSYQRDFMKLAGSSFGRGQAPNAPRGMTATPGARGGAGRQGTSGAALAGRRHRINLHMFEALLGLYEATKSPEVWYEIDQELTAIDRLFDRNIGYLPESYDEDWKPVGNPSGNPGHLFEWASLLSRAVELGADPKFIELGSRNLDLGLKSYNDAVGGLGGIDAAGRPTRMLWWPQCEVLKATATYAILHGRSDLWPYYEKTWNLIKTEYLDTEHGGWFAAYVPGEPRAAQGEKAFYKGSVDGPEWGAYHQSYMMYEIWRITDPGYKAWPRQAER
jgi:mannose/cellobiose epimerase-like protein (N-acyl-D-glucosamine 2-epimerase family)